MKKELNIDLLLVNYLTGTASDDERAAALRWINESNDNRNYFSQLQYIYNADSITDGNHHLNPRCPED